MIQLLLIGIAVATIVRIAKTRGAKPWLWGSVAVGGYVVLALVADVFMGVADRLPPSGVRAAILAVAFIAPWLPVALVALYVRFVIGRGTEGPYGRWTCQTCRSINEQYALSCESCGAKFAHPSAT